MSSMGGDEGGEGGDEGGEGGEGGPGGDEGGEGGEGGPAATKEEGGEGGPGGDEGGEGGPPGPMMPDFSAFSKFICLKNDDEYCIQMFLEHPVPPDGGNCSDVGASSMTDACKDHLKTFEEMAKALPVLEMMGDASKETELVDNARVSSLLRTWILQMPASWINSRQLSSST